MRRKLSLYTALIMVLCLLTACGTKEETKQTGTKNDNTLIYGSNDYTRINPAIDEHGEINALLFNGLTAHNEKNEVVPCLAKSWKYDEKTVTYTFELEEGVKWHDGKAFTADDVKFTIETIKDPENESEIASNYDEVKEIKVVNDHKIEFILSEPDVAFLEYMTIAVLPKHLLDGKDMQSDDYFRAPVGTGPYKFSKWDKGQSIALVKNEDYFKGAPSIEKIIFKIVVDDNAKALQLKSGEIDLAQVTPKDAANLKEDKKFTAYDMTTADYRGIMYNFNNKLWNDKRPLIKAFNCAIDRQKMVDSVLLGEGIVAYGPLQRNKYNNDKVEQYQCNPKKAVKIIEENGWKIGKTGYYEKNGKKLSFTVSVMEGDQVRTDLATIASQQLKDVGVEMIVSVQSEIDWDNQEAFLIGWGSPFDADDHTYKVFGTDKGSNYSLYSNKEVDKYLLEARQTSDEAKRAKAYASFQKALSEDPAYTFFCYVDVNYVTSKKLSGIWKDTVLGHHGVGIFNNVADWKIDK